MILFNIFNLLLANINRNRYGSIKINRLKDYWETLVLVTGIDHKNG